MKAALNHCGLFGLYIHGEYPKKKTIFNNTAPNVTRISTTERPQNKNDNKVPV